jgi:hypothetical protein
MTAFHGISFFVAEAKSDYFQQMATVHDGGNPLARRIRQALLRDP